MQIEIKGTETLERIATALERIAATLEKPSTETPAQIPESVKSTPVEVEAPKPEPQTAEPEPVAAEPEPVAAEPEPVAAEPEPVAAEPVADQPEEVKPTVTLDEIRKKVVQLSAAGAQAKDAVRAIVTEYGRNVSAIPADKYAEVMDRLNAVKEV